MSRKYKQHDNEFSWMPSSTWRNTPGLTQEECCKNLGISSSTLAQCKNQYKENNGEMPYRGSGNYRSEEQKEIARLNRELRDAKDALYVLKKPSAFWEKTDNSDLYRSSCQDGGCKSHETPYLHLWNAETSGRFPL